MLNEDVVIYGNRLVLVPYLPHHVSQYHHWMCDPELLRLTCSEPLSLEEEFENQKSWLCSSDKLTFILLAPSADGGLTMIGDCNAFMHPHEPQQAEVEVSIAERGYRRQGFAQEAVRLLMVYLLKHMHVTSFVAKILSENTPSIHLFTSSLRFRLWKEVKVFDEIHFIAEVGKDVDLDALIAASGYRQDVYNSAVDVVGSITE